MEFFIRRQAATQCAMISSSTFRAYHFHLSRLMVYTQSRIEDGLKGTSDKHQDLNSNWSISFGNSTKQTNLNSALNMNLLRTLCKSALTKSRNIFSNDHD
ncbi:conserved hypothetical protein [Trichinella spiralis]|uniref:hypothetical protein n=1 Tax=Trichinella spiralis TaxID=6334 RepID=UPI0001EFCF02|nr:conserved hypothetical protein [Trichinella spiralis]